MADCGMAVFIEYPDSGTQTQPEYLLAVYLRYAAALDQYIEQAFNKMDPNYLDDAGRGVVNLIKVTPDSSAPQLRDVKTSKFFEDPEFYSPGDRGLFVVSCYHDRWEVKRYDYPQTIGYEPFTPTVAEFTLRKVDAQVSQASPPGGL